MRLQNRRVFGVSALALGAALVLGGCGAGQLTQTDSQQPAVNGTHGEAGKLSLRNVAFQFPKAGAYAKDASVPLNATIVNNGSADDELVAVASDATGPGVIGGSKVIVAGHALVVAAPDVSIEPPAVSATPTATSSSAPTTTPTSTGKSSPATSSSSAESTPATTTAPPSAPAKPGEATVTLPKLKSPLWPGMTLKVTFTFKLSGTVTLDVPLAPAPHDRTEAPKGPESKPAEGH
ncbi:hypothetical protein SAMN05421504_102306 [Amycolatopsis xylanica]|uniref:Copper(I)-binding protein n=1 Tax=Amycolatopsis xylanica TaxID=589385 RepID=A0A1H2YXW3_9PSEU|nr:hypothetical protein [Amycolatopsis xylanica]SDX09966.1 hypothetical protein SAMN05421504_102306 [Amycolatopsis xylanica]